MRQFSVLAAIFAVAMSGSAEAQQGTKRAKQPSSQSSDASQYYKPCVGVHFVEDGLIKDSCRLPDGRVCTMLANGSQIELRDCKK